MQHVHPWPAGGVLVRGPHDRDPAAGHAPGQRGPQLQPPPGGPRHRAHGRRYALGPRPQCRLFVCMLSLFVVLFFYRGNMAVKDVARISVCVCVFLGGGRLYNDGDHMSHLYEGRLTVFYKAGKRIKTRRHIPFRSPSYI